MLEVPWRVKNTKHYNPKYVHKIGTSYDHVAIFCHVRHKATFITQYELACHKYGSLIVENPKHNSSIFWILRYLEANTKTCHNQNVSITKK